MNVKENNVRLFYALWPDEATRSALVKLQASIQGRMTHVQDLHLTLAFLGAQSPALLPVLQALMTRLPATAMTLPVDCIGYFPGKAICWAGIQAPPAALIALRQELLRALAQHNMIANQDTRFKPHITLARDAIAAAVPDMTPVIWRADHIALVQSTADGTTPCYRVLASRRLAP